MILARLTRWFRPLMTAALIAAVGCAESPSGTSTSAGGASAKEPPNSSTGPATTARARPDPDPFRFEPTVIDAVRRYPVMVAAVALLAALIGVGGVDEIHPLPARLGDDASGGGLVGRAAEVHGAETKRRDLHAAAPEIAVFHSLTDPF